MSFVTHQRAKILATIGPASSDYDTLLALAKAGVDTYRLNFSHGSHEEHKKVVDFIRQINNKYERHLGILADLQGPKLRIGEILNGSMTISEGDILNLINEECEGTMECIYMNYQDFAQDVKKGERVMIDDGKLVFEVLETNSKDHVKLKTLFGGELSSRKGVNLPDTKLSLPCLTEKDLADLEYMMTLPIQWIALSFVRSADDVLELKKAIKAHGHAARVVSKIEKPEALEDLENIIKVSDAVMIARGDLGVEVPMEQLPVIQKNIIRKCQQSAKPVIVATQLMESMVTNPSPTRAEVTDVANAILDGADCLMLSGETSVGIHPAKVIVAMNKIIDQAEEIYDIGKNQAIPERGSETFLSDVLCLNSAKTADELRASAILAMTSSGYTAFQISSYRFSTPIHVFSDQPNTLCMLNMVWGVKCHYYDRFTSTDETIIDVTNILKKFDIVKENDIVVNVGSMPLYKRYRANMMRITVVD